MASDPDIWHDMGDSELATKLLQHFPHMSDVGADIVVQHVRGGCDNCQDFVRRHLDNG